MLLIPHLLCMLGLLAVDTVHTSPLAEVKLQNETLALDNMHTAASAEVKLQSGSCPMFWYSFNGRCYKYVASRLNWADAEWNCVSQGANLVSIHSAVEHNYVLNLINNFDIHQGLTWIGLTDIYKEGRWAWSDGSKVRFTEWNEGEPNNQGNEHCVQTNWNANWNDKACSETYPSVCATRTNYP